MCGEWAKKKNHSWNVPVLLRANKNLRHKRKDETQEAIQVLDIKGSTRFIPG